MKTKVSKLNQINRCLNLLKEKKNQDYFHFLYLTTSGNNILTTFTYDFKVFYAYV